MHLKERELCFQVLGKGIFDMHVKRTPPLKSGVKVYAIIEESCNNKPYKRVPTGNSKTFSREKPVTLHLLNQKFQSNVLKRETINQFFHSV